MANNISKYCSLNDFALIEYEFSKDGVLTDFSSMGITIAQDFFGNKILFTNNSGFAIGDTNTPLDFLSVPTNQQRTTWFNNFDNTNTFYTFFKSFDASIALTTTSYPTDVIRLHLVQGYNYEDVAGFLLQVRAKDNSSNMVDLANFTYVKQPSALASSDVVKFNSTTLHLGNKFYDKYIEFKIPSIQELGGDNITTLGQALNIQQLSDVYLTYSSIPEINNYQYILSEQLNLNLPVTSVGDNFNCLITESTSGDYIEFYSTWIDQIIGAYMDQIESGRIRLYTSNNPNDNYQDFTDQYGTSARRWVLMHELSVYENMPSPSGGTSLLTQQYAFTQVDNFSIPNYFRPVLRNADIDASFSVVYICRLMNRMDGTQIIRKASFASPNPKKYGRFLNRLNVDNIIPYKVFNRLEAETSNIVQSNNLQKTKYVKVFFETTNVLMDQNNVVFPNGSGPLFLIKNDAVYLFKFEKLNTSTQQKTPVDLSGAYNYQLYFQLDDGTNISVSPTYSNNMNSTLGQLEFKLMTDQVTKLLKQTNTEFSIKVVNPDNTSYVFYTGNYFSQTDTTTILSNFLSLTNVSDLNNQITTLTSQVKSLQDQLSALQSK